MNCSFCKRDIEAGTGSMFIKRDGRAVRYCSNKCRKNDKLGRDPKNLKWISSEKRKKITSKEE